MSIDRSLDVKPAVIVLARSGVSAAPLEEMAGLAAILASSIHVSRVAFAFTEQGSPTFKDVFLQLVQSGLRDILILPWMLPLEPSFSIWISRVVQRWQIEIGGEPAVVRIGRGLTDVMPVEPLLEHLLNSAKSAVPISGSKKPAGEGSVVSDRKYRILVCNGGPCTQAGAVAVWSHLRRKQADLKLADHGHGMRSAKTSCLGPCGLAPAAWRRSSRSIQRASSMAGSRRPTWTASSRSIWPRAG